jgi:hypothetical protein
MSPAVQRVHDEITAHLAEIELLFKSGGKLTLLARRPSVPMVRRTWS